MKKWKIILPGILLLVLGWIAIDMAIPFQRNIARINAPETAKLEGRMWRSYYERKPLKLFLESARLMREQFHFPFWRSLFVAYYPAKAAFVFKDGNKRSDYEKAFPYLRHYYNSINNISDKKFDVDSAAHTELEWWIIRRERKTHPAQDWEKWITINASVVYHMPPEQFSEYAHWRVTAMLARDEKGSAMTERDWHDVNGMLYLAWQSLAVVLANRHP